MICGTKLFYFLFSEIFENALSMGFAKEEEFREIWLGYLDYLRRRAKNITDSGKYIL